MKKGDLTEALFYNAAIQYRNQRLLSFAKTHPEFVTQKAHYKGRGKAKKVEKVEGFFKAKGSPDWAINIRGLGFCWIDTKGATTDKAFTYLSGSAVEQYRKMTEDQEDSGVLGFFLVEWIAPDNSTNSTWRLYPVESLALNDLQTSIKVERFKGLHVPVEGDMPMFLDPILKYEMSK